MKAKTQNLISQDEHIVESLQYRYKAYYLVLLFAGLSIICDATDYDSGTLGPLKQSSPQKTKNIFIRKF